MTKTVSPYFDPDEFKISKPMVHKIITAIIKRWQKDTKSNWRQISAMKVFRMTIGLQSEEQINAVLSEIIKVTNKMQELNALCRLRGEMPKTEQLVAIALERLEADIDKN